jgi:phosphohistidine phosphatase
MKRLIFVRHGKAEDSADGISDLERSLTLKGKEISRQMARKLRETVQSPLTIVTSPAFRAIETALIFAVELGVDTDDIILNSDIYYRMNLRQLPEIISSAGNNCDTIILVGHNPLFTETANSLSSEGCDFIPKSGIVAISFNTGSWQEIRQKKGKQEYHLKPENVL